MYNITHFFLSLHEIVYDRACSCIYIRVAEISILSALKSING